MSQVRDLSVPDGENMFGAYESIAETTPAGQTVWSYPVNQAELEMAAAGGDMVALFPSLSDATWTLLFVNMATNTTTTASLPGGYEYSLATTAQNVVAVGSEPTGIGTPQPGYIAVYTSSGSPVKEWQFPDQAGELAVNTSSADGELFVEAQLLNGPVTSTTTTLPAVIYEIEGDSIDTYNMVIPESAVGFTAVTASEVLVYGMSATSESSLEAFSLAADQTTTSMWETTAMVPGEIVTNGTVAVVSGVDTAASLTTTQPVVDPAWLLNAQTGASEGELQLAGYGVYPIDAGSYGILAYVHQAGSSGPPQIAIFNPDGTLVRTEPANPEQQDGGAAFFEVDAQGALTSFYSARLPSGDALTFASAANAASAASSGSCQATGRERG